MQGVFNDYAKGKASIDVSKNAKKPKGENLAALMRALSQNPSEADLKDYMKEIGKTSIMVEDFQNFMENHWTDVTEEDIAVALSVFDREGTGSVSGKELRHVLANVGLKMKKDEIDAIFKTCKVGDGPNAVDDFSKELHQYLV